MNKISDKDLTSVLINVVMVKLILFYPCRTVNIAGNSSWIVSIYVTLVMLFVFFVMTRVYDFSETVTEKLRRCGGDALRIAGGLLIIFVLIASMCSFMRIYPETVKIIFLKHTPIEFLVFLTSAAAVFGVYCGMQSLGRVISIFLPAAGVIMAATFLLLIPHMELSNLTPILGPGIKTIFADGLTVVSGFSDIIVLFIIDSENGREKIKTGYKTILISGTVITLILFAYCSVVPYDVSQHYLMPIYQMTRVIQIGEFFSRFEIFFEFIWTILVMLYFSVYLYAICNVWSEIFKIPYHKPLAIPFATIVFSLSLMPGSYLEFGGHYMWFTVTVLCVTMLMPIVVGLCDGGKR